MPSCLAVTVSAMDEEHVSSSINLSKFIQLVSATVCIQNSRWPFENWVLNPKCGSSNSICGVRPKEQLDKLEISQPMNCTPIIFFSSFPLDHISCSKQDENASTTILPLVVQSALPTCMYLISG